MDKLVLLTNTTLELLTKTRSGETKFGEHCKVLASTNEIYDNIKNLDVNYVILGIPEDVGVYANLGNTGTSKAFEATIKVLLNIQSNPFTHADKVLVLGHLDFSEEIMAMPAFDRENPKELKKLRRLVDQIDKEVSDAIYTIVKAGKTPIIIGGGHNNAYGNIKGASLALNQSVNALNLDAHTDFRALEGRHSGNGFSYAYAEGFLDKYFMFGLHENYISNAIYDSLNSKKALNYNTFEDLEVRKSLSFKNELKRALEHIGKKPFGIEIDCDAIKNIPSSAKTPSGFSVEKARQVIHFFGKHKNATYLHICEAAPKKKQATTVGKLITYFITDFINANTKNE
ncbi:MULTISPECIES: formimidoylglutamase [Bizionia]|nr:MULTISPECIES: formimidoylglutamase [Bizionia]